MFKYFNSIIEQDRASVVICDLNHTIIYMNASAIKNYGKRGGGKLIGQSLLNCHNPHSNEMIEKVVAWFKEDANNNMIYTGHNDKDNKDIYMVALRDESKNLIGYYEKHEYRDREAADTYDFEKSLV